MDNQFIKPRKEYLESAALLKREGGTTAAPRCGVLVYARRPQGLLAAYFEEGVLEQIHLYPPQGKTPVVGEVYLGKVANVVENLNAAFVDVQKGVSGYLPLGESGGTDLFRTNRPNGGPLRAGDEVLVQVVKEALKTKQPMLSGKIKGGAATETSWETLKERAGHALCYERLVEVEPGWVSFFRKAAQQYPLRQVLTDDETVYGRLQDFAPEQPFAVKRYEDARISLSTLYSLETHLAELTQRKVWLKSGAYLIIEQTEAMTVIDVNSGKCLRKHSPDELIRLINTEAAREVFRQIKLRNLSGMILVDFLKFDERSVEQDFLHLLKKLAATDAVPTTVHDITALGIVEMTRKKVSKTLQEQLRGEKENRKR